MEDASEASTVVESSAPNLQDLIDMHDTCPRKYWGEWKMVYCSAEKEGYISVIRHIFLANRKQDIGADYGVQWTCLKLSLRF